MSSIGSTGSLLLLRLSCMRLFREAAFPFLPPKACMAALLVASNFCWVDFFLALADAFLFATALALTSSTFSWAFLRVSSALFNCFAASLSAFSKNFAYSGLFSRSLNAFTFSFLMFNASLGAIDAKFFPSNLNNSNEPNE